MSMSLAALEILEQADLPPAHARAIVRAIEADSATRLQEWVTQPMLKVELAQLKGELREEIHDVRVEIRDVKSELIRWIFLAVMAQTAASGGLMYFLLNLVR